MGRRTEIFKFLASEDVNSHEMDLGVTMLAGFRSAHFNDFAGTAFDDDKTVLAERRTLHRIGGGSTCIGAIECVLMLREKE